MRPIDKIIKKVQLLGANIVDNNEWAVAYIKGYEENNINVFTLSKGLVEGKFSKVIVLDNFILCGIYKNGILEMHICTKNYSKRVFNTGYVASQFAFPNKEGKLIALRNKHHDVKIISMKGKVRTFTLRQINEFTELVLSNHINSDIVTLAIERFDPPYKIAGTEQKKRRLDIFDLDQDLNIIKEHTGRWYDWGVQ